MNQMIDGSMIGIVELSRDDWFLAWEAYEVIFHSARHSVRSDVWSFGTVMWEIFTNGRVPFGNMSAARIKRKVGVFSL